ncbi:hypothetical protein [Natrarchaeobius chitinivorans]|uniref:Uncharacterized protein n=1 Tax=Natrarchaeobius chitinivorans TaxID=1679083 RepID=A0A3N6LKK5_NATCH|nr:hypothetical protein [Natrarchaeobius chitinivorans]RQG89353.1 hypothetical protein EA473_22370 [Natrarchaeobius chitinivorans]
MAYAMTSELESLQVELQEYLKKVDRAGDPDRLAQRLTRKHSVGSYVVGFRRRGREVFLYEEGGQDESDVLRIHEIGIDGHLPCVGTVWKGRDLDQWIRHHRPYLEWIHPAFRVD